MAGQHFTDPRVFYDMTADQKYVSLDDLFNFRKEPKFIESEYRVKGGSSANQKKKKDDKGESREQTSKIQTVELDVSLCCDRCVWRVKQALEDVQGVEWVDCEQLKGKVWVRGSVKPEVVLRKVRKVKRDAELVVKKKQS